MSFNFETKSSYSIRVQTDDGHGGTFPKQLTVSVTNVTDAPTNLALSNSSVAENRPSGTAVGTLSSTDPDTGESHTYSLVPGAGSTDNASFAISGTLAQHSRGLRLRDKVQLLDSRSDQRRNGGTFAKQLTISMTDVERAADEYLTLQCLHRREPASGTAVGTLSSTDPDGGGTHSTRSSAGTGSTDNGSFSITGTSLKTASGFNFEKKSSYAIRVRRTMTQPAASSQSS